MRKEYLTCSVYVKSIVQGLIQMGVPPDPIYKILETNESELNNPESWISLDKLVILEQQAKTLINCPEIGIRISQDCNRYNDAKAGLVGEVAASCETVGEAFHAAIRYSQLLSDGIFMGIENAGKYSKFIYYRKHQAHKTIFNSEAAIAESFNILRQFGNILEIHFEHSKTDYYKIYEDYFSCSLYYNQTSNMIVFEKSILNRKNKFHQPYVNKIIKKYADQLLLKLDTNPDNFREKVSSIIVQNIEFGIVSIDFVADKLNMSRQSLYRKLKAENITFTELLDSVRKDLAINLINTNQHSLLDISFLLGFSEQSSFSRAYKRWFGKKTSGD